MTKTKTLLIKLVLVLCVLVGFGMLSDSALGTHTVYATSLQDLIDTGVIDPNALDVNNLANFFLGDGQPVLDISIGGESVAATSTVQVLFLFTLIALAPSLLIMVTSFTRIIIVMHFLRNALGTQQMPPNQILIGLALFLTFFLMSGHFTDAHQNAFVPYSEGLITQAEALERGIEPFREHMIHNTGPENLAFFGGVAGIPAGAIDGNPDNVPLSVLIPAFIVSELTIGFVFGFFLFLPFIVIDMVVASVLMAMGMMMLPPAMISTPFKILLFIMVDGWNLVIAQLIETINITRL